MLRMFGDSMKIFDNQEYFDSLEEKDRVKIIDCLFIFCLTWSIGACVVTEHRRNFNI